MTSDWLVPIGFLLLWAGLFVWFRRLAMKWWPSMFGLDGDGKKTRPELPHGR